MFTREQTKTVAIGDRIIGGGNPILIQSMTQTRTEDHPLHRTDAGSSAGDP